MRSLNLFPQLVKPGIVIALYALLLPAVGPLLDHHYVEWQHNHSHVYFGGAPTETGFHVHIYDVVGAHAHRQATENSTRHSLPEGMVYLSGFEGLGISPVSAPTGLVPGTLIFPDLGDHLLLADCGILEQPLVGIRVAPPRKPPVA